MPLTAADSKKCAITASFNHQGTVPRDRHSGRMTPMVSGFCHTALLGGVVPARAWRSVQLRVSIASGPSSVPQPEVWSR